MKKRTGIMALAIVIGLSTAGAQPPDQNQPGGWADFDQEGLDVLAPAQVIMPLDANYPHLENRARQMAPSLAVSPSGRLWAVWYGGPSGGEDENNYVVLACSDNDGLIWREILVIDPDGPGPLRALDPQVWFDPQGQLWVFWAQAVTHVIEAHTWAVVSENPEAASPEWSVPRMVASGLMLSKPTVLSDGTWLFPISDTEAKRSGAPGAATAGVWASTDMGKTFVRRGAAVVPPKRRNWDEHMIIERRDGSLWMLVRTTGGFIEESVSTDGGYTWAETTPTAIPHPHARFFIRRLASGNLLLIKHGSMEQPDTPLTGQSARSSLRAFISLDDGISWQGGLLLDRRIGISYPDGQQAADGSIYIAYDHSRTGAKSIHFAVFREEDAVAGRPVSGDVRLRELISTGMQNPPVVPGDGRTLITQPAGQLATDNAAVLPLTQFQMAFKDQTLEMHDYPAELEGACFLQLPRDGQKVVRVTRPGMVYVFTPQAHRSEFSQSDMLIRQGFTPVALPEFAMWWWREEDLGTLYQKYAREGETIEFGRWAIPVFLSD